MIKEIKDFIATCPHLNDEKINVNYLSEDIAAYSIEAVPSSPVVKKYADGGEMRQQLFVFALREAYNQSIKHNTAIMRFYEDFSEWVDEQNKKSPIPIDLGPGLEPFSIEVLTGGYLMDADSRNARYQIQCRLVYIKN